MNDLRELIGLEVNAIIGYDDNDEDVIIKAKITNVNINDYYFDNKLEPIYITVNVKNLDPLPKGFDYDSLIDINLGNITKAFRK